MAINLSDNIKINAPKPIESKYLNINIPYTGTTQVNNCISSGERYPGLTVNINNAEYWYCGDILDACLIQKTSGSGGGITGATNGLTSDGNTVVLGGSLTGNTIISLNNNTEFRLNNTGNTINYICINDFFNTIGLLNNNILLDGINDTLSLSTLTGGSIFLDGIADTISIGTTCGASILLDGIGDAINSITSCGASLNINGITDSISLITNSGSGSINLCFYQTELSQDDTTQYTNLTMSATDFSLSADNCVDSLTEFTINSSNVFVGNTYSGFTGIQYCGDYSTNYVDRSLIDKGYLVSQISGITGSSTLNAANGLTKTGNTIILGGTLTGNTTIDLGGFCFLLGGISGIQPKIFLDESINQICVGAGTSSSIILSTCINLSATNGFRFASSGGKSVCYFADYSSCYVDRSLVDKEFVDNKIIYYTSYSAVTLSAVTLSTTGSSLIILVNNTGATTITLPATPIDGRAFKIKDASGNAGSNNITISGNGKNIDGSGNKLISTNYGVVELMFQTTLDKWFSL